MSDQETQNIVVEYPDLYNATILELRKGLDDGKFSSRDLVEAYLARIAEVNQELHAVIETNPKALEQASLVDNERSRAKNEGRSEEIGILHGIPIIVKDNIATAGDGMQTTAGSHALVGSVVPRDAHVVARLRKAGAIILAKANLAEWSNYRGHKPGMANGWSGRGGQCTNAYLQNGDPGGSSSGSGVCASIGLAAGALGTETNGSIVSPSQRSNIVGIKPTVGLTSRNGVIPISEHEDTVGPMCRCVADAAILLQAIVGPDDRDPYTADQPVPPPVYTTALRPEGLRGVRIGVPRKAFAGESWLKEWPDILPAFEQALDVLRALGAEVVDPVDYEITADVRKRTHEQVVMAVEMKDGVNRYLSEMVEVPTGVRTLADVLAFNDAHPELEKPPGYHDQSRMQEAEDTEGFDEKYLEALQHCKELSTHSLILKSLKTDNLRALVYPSNSSAIIYSAALAGFPHITVPLGFMSDDTPDLPSQHPKLTGPGLPFGIGFTGKAYSSLEKKTIRCSYAADAVEPCAERWKRLALKMRGLKYTTEWSG